MKPTREQLKSKYAETDIHAFELAEWAIEETLKRLHRDTSLA